MDDFARLNPRERRLLFEETAVLRNMQALIIEKDFWVCWTLKVLFNLPGIGEHLIFKGGTSLSKVYKVIERFSEDIDVSIDRGYLGFGGANEPEAGDSNKEKLRRIEALKIACQEKISRELLPVLETNIRARLRHEDNWSLEPDDDDPDRQTLLFHFPTAFPSDNAGYIRRVVKIEMGARADHWPCATHTVTPFVAEAFPSGFREPHATVKVLSVERTFWEKATILHAEFHRPRDKATPERFSRHYCDFHEMVRRGVSATAVKNLDLLARVAEHKGLYFRSSWAKYGEAVKGTLRIAPPEHRIRALREDYARMQQMFFAEPPEFDGIIALLQRWESDFNQG